MSAKSSAGYRALCAAAGLLVVSAVLPADARPGQSSQSAPVEHGPATVTFNQHIAPILYEHCAGCHRPEQVGPFSLITYEDARSHATQIAEATGRRYMPPWKPDPGVAEFDGRRGLSDAQITLIGRWVREGRVRGDAADLPAIPQWPTGWRLGRPDLVVELSEDYRLPGDGADVFRTFVIPIPLQERRFVRGLEFNPGNPKAVHHANLKIDATRSSRWLDEQEPGPGYEGAGARGAKFPDGYFLGWTPGQSPQVVPAGLSWRLDAGSDLVVELHMMPTGKPESVRPRVALYFTDRPPADLPYMIRLGRQDIDIEPGDARYVSTDSYVLPVDVDIVAVQPHAHNLAREVRGYATLPDGTVKWLVSISDWDTRWQDVYHFRQPLPLPAGTRLTMAYRYDNSAANVRNPNHPPQRVTFGQTSSSEMGDLWVQVMPHGDADRRLLDASYAPKMLHEDIAGLEKMLEMHPDDARISSDLGFCYLDADRPADALRLLVAAARVDLASSGALYDAGTLLLKQRRFGEARNYLKQALALKPDFSEALNNLGVISHAEGDLPQAMEWYTRALQCDPENADAEYNIGRALTSLGQKTAALEHLRRSLQLKPDSAATHVGIASLLASGPDLDEAIVHYRRALELDPDLPAALVDLAWILATSERPDLRAPAEAVRLAERASARTGGTSATALDTLAVAYAASGRPDLAVATAEHALSVASAVDARELMDRIRIRLAAYKQIAGRP